MIQPLRISATPIAPPAPRGARMLDIAAVANRLNNTERQARRRCVEEWFPRGLASMQPSESTGKLAWHVRDDAHPLLARAVFPEHLVFDQRHLTTLQRTALQYRHRIYTAWRGEVEASIRKGGTADDATRLFLGKIGCDPTLAPPKGVIAPTSTRTLFAWYAGYRQTGIAALVDERWLRKADTSDGLDDPFFTELLRQYLKKSQPTLALIYRVVSAIAPDHGWQVLSYKKCQRLLARVPAAAKIKLRQGNKAYVDHAERFASRDYSSLRSNEVWNGDHHRFDVIVSHEGKHIRPWLTLWQDVRSRKIVGFRVFGHDPNTYTILQAFRDAVGADGVPDGVYVDNGRDFDSKALQGITKRQRRQGITEAMRGAEGVFNTLGVTVKHCQPYHGQSKPVERLFRIVKDEFSKLQATYCGGTPSEKPDDLPARLKRGAAPKLDDFADAFAQWVDYYNTARPHSGDSMDGRTPGAVFDLCLTEKRTAPADVLDGLTLMPTKPLKIAQNGVRWMGISFTANELWRRLGEEVRLHIDPEDIRTVHVYNLDGRFVCIAEPAQRLDFKTSIEQLKALGRAKAKDRAAVERYHQRQPHLSIDPIAALNRRAAAAIAATAREPATMPALRLVGGDRAAEVEKAQQSIERRERIEAEPRIPQMSFAELMSRRMAEAESQRLTEEELSAADARNAWDKLSRVVSDEQSKRSEAI